MRPGPILLDTNIVSYLFKAHGIAELYRPHIEDRLALVAFPTVGEIYAGAEKGNWGVQKRADVESFLNKLGVAPYDRDTARHYGRIFARRQSLGRPIGYSDAWIAACALRHRLPLVTHNRRDFEHIPELVLISESPK